MIPVNEFAPEPPPIYIPPPPAPGFWQGVWIFLQLQFIPAIVAVPLVIAGLKNDQKFHEHPFALLAGTLLASAWVIRSYCRRSAVSLRALAGPLTLAPALLSLLAIGVVGILLVEVPLALWLMVRYSFLDPHLDFGISRSPFGAFLLIVIAAPLTEEVIFRAILLRGFTPRYGFSRGLALAAALFALSHIFPIRLPGMFAVGFLLGWVLLRTGSIWPGVLAHAFNNAIAFVLMLQQPQLPPPQALAQLGPWALPILLTGIVLLTAAIVVGRRVLSNPPRLAVP
jgi:membrane protease YdiL (CAAX protease family)